MKNSIKAKIQKALHNTKGFTLVELIVVTVIIMILATMATTSYLRFVEDAKVAKDTAYIKGLITQVEVLVANDKLDIPSTNKTTADYTNTNDTFVLTITYDGTWSGDLYVGSSNDATKAASNVATIQSNSTKQELTSTAAKKDDVEIRVQVYGDVPKVFVYSTDSDYWYPYTMEWAGEGTW